MNHIVEGELTTLADAKLEQLANHCKQMVRLAAIKATAHLHNPREYPMPATPDSVEAIILQRLQKMSPERKQAATRKLSAFVALAPELRNRQLGTLASVDLRSAQPMATQASAVAMPASMRFERSRLDQLLKAPSTFLDATHQPVGPDAGLAPQSGYDNLELRIHRVKCLDETNPEWPGDDEIALGGVTIDETGDVKKVPAFTVGNNFDDGESRYYSPPKQFASFGLTEGGNKWPKTYYVTMVLAEKDNGGFPEFLEGLLKKVKDYVAPLIGTAIGAGIGAAAGPIGAVIGAIVGAVLGAMINWIIQWWEDDLFPALKRYATIYSYNQLFASGQHTSSLKYSWTQAHGGTYGIWYDWRVYP